MNENYLELKRTRMAIVAAASVYYIATIFWDGSPRTAFANHGRRQNVDGE